ncbi:MAG: helix-turn-helix domain-containing protein [Deltaproteobacteria bacterium]|nr:MAG: helix-turn-helix domain-containing protein [Deltaproteobacteria bacterium]
MRHATGSGRGRPPPDEIAARWHLRRRRVYALIRAGALPVVQVGRSLRVPQRALEVLHRRWWLAAAAALGGRPVTGPGARGGLR